MRWRRLTVLLIGMFSASSWLCAEEFTPELYKDPHLREELGVNEFTTPSIKEIFQLLEALHPLPEEGLERKLPGLNYPSRVQMALNLGGIIADGFLAVQAQKKDRIEEVGRILLKQSRALGVSDRVTRHSKSVLEHAFRGEWDKLKEELGATQEDVENAMIDLRDERLAHMIALGGWLRGFEVASACILSDFSAEKAQLLTKIDLAEYFIDRLNTLHPKIKKTELITKTSSELKTALSILDKEEGQPLLRADVQEVHDIIKGINRAIAAKS